MSYLWYGFGFKTNFKIEELTQERVKRFFNRLQTCPLDSDFAEEAQALYESFSECETEEHLQEWCLTRLPNFIEDFLESWGLSLVVSKDRTDNTLFSCECDTFVFLSDFLFDFRLETTEFKFEREQLIPLKLAAELLNDPKQFNWIECEVD